MEKTPTYTELEKRWLSLTRILFGQEVGELFQFENYLMEFEDPVVYRKSSLNGKEVAYSRHDYCTNAKWLSFDEVDFEKKFEPLGINDVKDIDSVFEAVKERVFYTGNIILGNSKFVEKSSDVDGSFYVHQSTEVEASKYVAFSSIVRDSEMVFGCNTAGDGKFMLRSNGFINMAKCFEVWVASASSECYYSHDIDGCLECMFCFNLRNGRFSIGNLELGKEKYHLLKKKLLSEMAGKLARDKRLPSLVQLAAKGKDYSAQAKKEIGQKLPARVGEKQEMKVVEEAFARSATIVLGRPLAGLESYGGWLSRHTRELKKCKSAVSGEPVFCANYGCRYMLPDKKFLTESEARKFGEHVKLSESDIAKFSLASAGEAIGRISFFSPLVVSGQNANTIECVSSISSTDCFRCVTIGYSNKCAYTFMPRYSEHVFGCSRIIRSSFCIKCYNSAKITRCFEVDNATACSDCYYCHNVENCHNCLFCFNVKNLSYAIGNVAVGKEKFFEAKKALIGWLQSQLSEKKEVGLDVYNVGCGMNCLVASDR